jgi:hypothetical protein
VGYDWIKGPINQISRVTSYGCMSISEVMSGELKCQICSEMSEMFVFVCFCLDLFVFVRFCLFLFVFIAPPWKSLFCDDTFASALGAPSLRLRRSGDDQIYTSCVHGSSFFLNNIY